MAIAVSTFLTAALSEIRVARAGDVLSPDDADLALLILNELLDALNADDRALYNVSFGAFTLTPNHQPHTIGLSTNTPTPDLTVTIARPLRILSANILLANNIRVPCDPIDDAQWAEIRAGAATGQALTISVSIPPKLYYSPDWPNGSIYLWPPPNIARGLELRTETLLAQLAASDTLDLPPGYQQALRLTLAELLAPAFGQQVSPSTAEKAREARGRAWAANDSMPTLTTLDGGMPHTGSRRGRFNYLTGETT